MSTINYVVTNSTSALIDNNLVIATIYIAYALVGVCSFIGNVSVLLLVVVGREMLHSATNIFVGSLSATDLLITCVSHWATPYYTIRNNNWNLGSFMCYAVSAVQAASLMWSPFTLSAIAIDRYRSVSTMSVVSNKIKTVQANIE
jgi:leucokinin receptor